MEPLGTTNKAITEKLKKHQDWLCRLRGGERADFSGQAFNNINLSDRDFKLAVFKRARLTRVSLAGCLLEGAIFRGASLLHVDFRHATLVDADMTGATLSGVSFGGADLSGVRGLISPIDFLQKNFEHTPEGIIVYKIFNEFYPQSKHWEIADWSILTETCNPDRSDPCGCGINVAPLSWFQGTGRPRTIWKCLIKWEWLPGVVVPFSTDGKIRTERLQLLGQITLPMQ